MIGKRLAVILIGTTLPVAAQSVDEIVEKSLAARGGAERIRAIRSQRLVGKIAFENGQGQPFLIEIKRPSYMREEITAEGRSIIRGTDGKSGWQTSPAGGSQEVQPLGVEDIHNMASGADIEGPLLDYKEKGNRVELAGKVKVEDRSAWKLKVTLNSGEVRFDFVDAETYQEIKFEGKLTVEGQTREVESYFRDFRDVSGVRYPFRIESGTAGGPINQRIVFDKVEVNPEIDSSRFQRP